MIIKILNKKNNQEIGLLKLIDGKKPVYSPNLLIDQENKIASKDYLYQVDTHEK